MRLLRNLAILLMLAAIAVPVSAKIYPDDFLYPSGYGTRSQPAMGVRDVTAPVMEPMPPSWGIPQGVLTRAQFIDAIASRLYSGQMHDECFAEIASSLPVRYSLLFRDVAIDAPEASSVCVAMQSGLLRGHSDGTFRPRHAITAAEAAAILARLALTVRSLRRGEAWYAPAMEAMRRVDAEFTMQPAEVFTGAHLRHALCILRRSTPAVDPLGEFTGC